MRQKKRIKSFAELGLILSIIIVINILSSFLYGAWDITEDKRFTLAPSTYKMIEWFSDDVSISVYLAGDLPSEYKRVENEIGDLLEKLNSHNNYIQYLFTNPFPPQVTPQKKDSIERQLRIRSFPTSDNRQGSTIYYACPYATINYNGKNVTVEILEPSDIIQDPNTGYIRIRNINKVINQLEYKFANELRKLQLNQRPKIAILSGHGEHPMFAGVNAQGRRMPNLYTYSFQEALAQHYDYDELNLDVAGRVDSLWDLLIIAKPSRALGTNHKVMIDQYIMNGGKVLWLLDALNVETDSIIKSGGIYLPLEHPIDFINDQLFTYGARVNQNLLSSWDAGCIDNARAGSLGVKTAQKWFYYPLVSPHHPKIEAQETGEVMVNHPIVKDLDFVQFQYGCTVDTVKTPHSTVNKTILMRSSPYSKVNFIPFRITGDALSPGVVQKDAFKKSDLPVAVLLEGNFRSYANKPGGLTTEQLARFEQAGYPYPKFSKNTKMIIVSDGDLIKNEVHRPSRKPLPLGAGWAEGQGPFIFSNQDFLFNCINYLLDDQGIMAAKTKELKLRPLDQERAFAEETQWQIINLVLPLAILAIFGGIYVYLRRRRYANPK